MILAYKEICQQYPLWVTFYICAFCIFRVALVKRLLCQYDSWTFLSCNTSKWNLLHFRKLCTTHLGHAAHSTQGLCAQNPNRLRIILALNVFLIISPCPNFSQVTIAETSCDVKHYDTIWKYLLHLEQDIFHKVRSMFLWNGLHMLMTTGNYESRHGQDHWLLRSCKGENLWLILLIIYSMPYDR